MVDSRPTSIDDKLSVTLLSVGDVGELLTSFYAPGWTQISPLVDEYRGDTRINLGTPSATIYAKNVYLDARTQTANVFDDHVGPTASEAPAGFLTGTPDAPMVSVRVFLLLGGILLILFSIGAVIGNAFSSAMVMHPFLIGIVFIGGVTFSAMSRARFD